ncbi:MAG: hypothetical protein M8364_20415 [Methylobacter sp.]|uniref:hypothetical protein n=1 Tax=Methylobacter sp. TaxID=2051955 RepID=UPI00258CB3F8|nr:hypothetical protein [Methylobacter sp.]MCL7423257.1 hypothetical protein [Methylobacter sp.]
MKLSSLLDKTARLFRKQAITRPPDQQYETDRQMLLRVARQFAVLFIAIILFDDIFGFVAEVLHFIFELLHLFIEVIEGFIEEVLEHLLHTGHHASETIIVNTVLIIMIYGLYRFYRASPRLYRRIKRNRLAAWLRYKRRKTRQWRARPRKQKIKLIAAYTAGTALLLFWLTL